MKKSLILFYCKEVRVLERTLGKIGRCLDSIYMFCTPYNSLNYIRTKWFQLIRNLWLYKGGREAVNRLKEYNRVLKLSFQYEKVPQELRVKWCKCDHLGLPKDISFLKPWLASGHLRDKRFAIDVLNTYRLFYLPPTVSTESITEPGKAPLRDSVGWKKFLTFWVRKFRQPKLGWSDKQLGWGTTKAGPNGPALMAAHLDATALTKDPELNRNYNDWCRITGQLQLLRHSNSLIDEAASAQLPRGLRHSKLSFLSEGGGKTRVIAIADYWTQQSLQGLHKWSMECLRRLNETDGTYDHEAMTQKLLCETGSRSKDLFSLDLSNATDRFPVSLQVDLLTEIVGQKAASAWLKLMVERDFVVNKDQKVRYSCGQPMGLLSSWAVFSLTHHAFIEYAAFKEGFPAFRDYYMLGDDVVICNTRVANRYLKLMDEIGVDISMPKSFISKTTDLHHVAEFAKRTLVDGVDLSPIPADLLKETIGDIFMFPTFIRKIRELGRGLTPEQETRICNRLYGAIPKAVALVMTAPQDVSGIEPWDPKILRRWFKNKKGEFAPIEGFTFSSFHDPEVVKRTWIETRIEHLLKTQERQVGFFMKTMDADEGIYTDLKKKFPRRRVPISHSVLQRDVYDPLQLHPLVNKVQHLHWTFWSVEEELRTLLESVPDLSGVQCSELKLPEFMPQVEYSAFLGYKRQEARTRSSLVRRLFTSLNQQVSDSSE